MMNNKVFSQIVIGLNGLNDEQGAQLLSIIAGMTSVAKSPKTQAPKNTKGFKGTAKDVTVEMTATKNTVSLGSYTKKDVWEVLKRRFETSGGKYDKTAKVITFKTAKDAKAFASNNVVSASERQSIWNEWAMK